MRIGRDQPESDMRLIEVAGLLHDVRDRKYDHSTKSIHDVVTELLTPLGFENDFISKVEEVINGVSFSKEHAEKKMFPELAAVQDADRLDAIGAIGIGR